MLENEIQNEVNRLSSYAKQKPKRKKIDGLVENVKEPIGKRIVSSLFEGNFKTVATSLIYEVMIPKTKDLLADLFIGGIEKAIYGDDTNQRPYTRSSGPSRKASYDAYYSNGRYYTTDSTRPAPGKAKVRWNYIVMRTRPAAIDLLQSLRTDIKRYGKVSITDLYDYVTDIDEDLGASIDSEFPDSNYGWTNLDRVPIESVRGGFWVKLPKPVAIN